MKRIFAVTAIVLSSVMQSFAIDMSREIDAAAAKVLPLVIQWRRFLHEHPELSNREVNTGKMVADELRKLGIEVRTGVAKTGVIGILKGGQPGPVIGLRADMDALPVVERTNVPFKSTVTSEYNGQTVGVMHACLRKQFAGGFLELCRPPVPFRIRQFGRASAEPFGRLRR